MISLMTHTPVYMDTIWEAFKLIQLKFNFLLLRIESKVWTFKNTLYSTMIHVLPANLFGLLFIKSYYNVIKDLIVENNFLYKSNGSLQPKSNNKWRT